MDKKQLQHLIEVALEHIFDTVNRKDRGTQTTHRQVLRHYGIDIDNVDYTKVHPVGIEVQSDETSRNYIEQEKLKNPQALTAEDMVAISFHEDKKIKGRYTLMGHTKGGDVLSFKHFHKTNAGDNKGVKAEPVVRRWWNHFGFRVNMQNTGAKKGPDMRGHAQELTRKSEKTSLKHSTGYEGDHSAIEGEDHSYKKNVQFWSEIKQDREASMGSIMLDYDHVTGKHVLPVLPDIIPGERDPHAHTRALLHAISTATFNGKSYLKHINDVHKIPPWTIKEMHKRGIPIGLGTHSDDFEDASHIQNYYFQGGNTLMHIGKDVYSLVSNHTKVGGVHGEVIKQVHRALARLGLGSKLTELKDAGVCSFRSHNKPQSGGKVQVQVVLNGPHSKDENGERIPDEKKPPFGFKREKNLAPGANTSNKTFMAKFAEFMGIPRGESDHHNNVPAPTTPEDHFRG